MRINKFLAESGVASRRNCDKLIKDGLVTVNGRVCSLGEEIDESDVIIGIEGYLISAAQASAYNMPQGFYISKIADGKGADKAGIEMGNIITEIEGKKIDSVDVIKNILADKKVGDKVKVKVSYISRNQYKEKEVEITLSK